MPLSKKKKSQIVEKFAREKKDTGSPEVQVALLSAEIEALQDHLNEHKGDSPAKVSLLGKVAKRRRLLRYFSAHNPDRYGKLIKKIGLKK